jgi:hypothetical protein
MAIESAETVSMEVMDVPYLKVIAGLHVLVEMYDEQVTMMVNEPTWMTLPIDVIISNIIREIR